MTKQKATERIKKAVDTLNGLANNLTFKLEETPYSLSLVAASKTNPFTHFGIYEPTVLYKAFVSKKQARETFMQMVEQAVAWARLNDPKSYHNFIAGQRGIS